MITYYVKKGEVYKVSATVKCDIYDGNGEIFNSCEAGSFVTFNAPTAKIVVSDGSAVLSCLSEVSGDLSGLSEHVNNSSIHTTPTDKSRWNSVAGDLSDIENDIPELERSVQTLGDTVDTHIGSNTVHLTNAERQNWNAAHTHTNTSDVHITSSERQTWNSKANGTHGHAISDITNLQTTLNGKASTSDIANLQTALNGKASTSDITNLQTALNGKASTSDLAALDVGVKRIDYWTEEGEGVQIYSNSKTLTDASSFSDSKEYKATKDVCLIYTVTNSPGSGQTSDFSGFYYNYPLKMWMGVKVNGSYLICEAASRRICSGGIDFIEVHLKAGDEVKFNTSSISTYTGYVRIRLLEFNYR